MTRAVSPNVKLPHVTRLQGLGVNSVVRRQVGKAEQSLQRVCRTNKQKYRLVVPFHRFYQSKSNDQDCRIDNELQVYSSRSHTSTLKHSIRAIRTPCFALTAYRPPNAFWCSLVPSPFQLINQRILHNWGKCLA